MDLTQWLAVIGGLAGLGATITAIYRVVIDRKAGVDSKELSNDNLEVVKENQAYAHLLDLVEKVRADNSDIRADRADLDKRVDILEKRSADQAVEISERLDEIQRKNDRIIVLDTDIDVLLEHILAGRQPPPPPLRSR